MPSRPVVALIVVFWLTMMGWLFYREIRPRLLPDEPPPFLITKADETKDPHEAAFWYVARNGRERAYQLTSYHEYQPAEDSFKFNARFTYGTSSEMPPEAGAAPVPSFQQVRMTSEYTVDREGRMRRLDITSEYNLVAEGGELPVEVNTNGESRDRQFGPSVRVKLPGLNVLFSSADRVRPLDAVDVSWHGIVLNPLHPPPRIPGLKAGRSWRVPAIDPLGLAELIPVLAEGNEQTRALARLVGPVRGAWMLNARVKDSTTMLRIKVGSGEQFREFECWRIDYTSESLAPLEVATWVAVSDNKVIQQEVHLWNDHWMITRQ